LLYEWGGVGSIRTVEGNFIGTDLTGTHAIPNGGYWETAQGHARLASDPNVFSAAADGGTVGGPSGALDGMCGRACNLISGNLQPGVEFIAETVPSMEGNLIGRSSAGAPLPNHGAGVEITHGANKGIIGGVGGKGNLIADNQGPAIELTPNTTPSNPGKVAPAIQGNAITGNKDGIVYPAGTATAETPTNLTVTIGGLGSLTISGEIPNFFKGAAYERTIELFGDTRCEPGHQGAEPLATFTVGSTKPTFTFTASVANPTLKVFMVTDTYEGSTSMFSTCVH
jgi:hypothetical protein